MRYIDEFRDPVVARRLIAEIQTLATRRHVLMEVCGGQTHGLLRYGIDVELRDTVELVHGPGCPVCVTPTEDIDLAVRLSRSEGVTVASFGDMLRVPGSCQSLLDARAEGGRVRIVYSPVDAVMLARRNPNENVVFFAVGFETTAPATALAVLQAQRLGLENFSLLVSHVRVQPAMEALMAAPGNRVEGFLAAGHVCTVSGFASYEEFVARYRVPVVVTGFEPIDLLEGIRDCVRQLEQGQAKVTNQYARSVGRLGNPHALSVIEQVYDVVTAAWRGFGLIHNGGFRLRKELLQFDARVRFAESPLRSRNTAELPLLPQGAAAPFALCPAAAVLSGQMRPDECPHFGRECTPLRPLGAPMVSSEGACAAYFRYHGPIEHEQSAGLQVAAGGRSADGLRGAD